jgi:predicted enzyme related to lactoylglutathione lyase
MAWLHVFIDAPVERHRAAADFWGPALGWPVGDPWKEHPEFRSFEPADGRAYVHLQQIGGQTRVHLDVEADDQDETVRRAADLGADILGGQDRWTTLSSPGGLPFCMVPTGDDRPPEPVTWPDGHRTRMVQVCVDSPRSVHDAEVAFWRAFLPGRWAPSASPEFAGKWHDDAGSPVQLLFQVLDEEDGPTRAHLDLGTDDLDAEVARLVQLGATDVGRGRGGWHVLRDPAGSLFCATLNSPEQTRRREIG